MNPPDHFKKKSVCTLKNYFPSKSCFLNGSDRFFKYLQGDGKKGTEGSFLPRESKHVDAISLEQGLFNQKEVACIHGVAKGYPGYCDNFF